MSIAENIEKVEERISRACRVSGRKRGEITLAGVTKFRDLSAVNEAWNAGIRVFGESKVREGVEKFTVFRDNHPQALVHLIGTLQRNKAKAAVGFFDCVQSVDRIELIPELEKFAACRGKPLDILLELRTGEETKSGFQDVDSLCKAAETALGMGNLRLTGLMTMAPLTGEQGQIRASFKRLSTARDVLEGHFPSGETCSWACLSMGMSNDFEIAVEEGATMLRIGTAIFGN